MVQIISLATVRFLQRCVLLSHLCQGIEGNQNSTKRNIELAFTSKGFYNWKNAKVAFRNHEDSTVHRISVEMLYTLPRTTKDIGETLSESYANEKKKNREYLLKSLQNVRFLARQDLALRSDGSEENSNFIQFIKEMINKKTDKYTSADIQNEMLKIMSLNIFREIAANLQNGVWYTIMADKVTDASNREQVIVCLRWTDEQFEACEEFIGLYKVDQIDSDTIVAVLKDTLLRMNLKIENCRGDGAANMTGTKKGVATQLRQTEPRALPIHCYGHALNLAVSETMRTSKVMRDALDTTFEISKLIKLSPKRDSLFEKLKPDISPGAPGFRTLCPTRWTVRGSGGSSFKSVAQNYGTLQELWYESKDLTKDTEMKARIITGIIRAESQMKTF